MKLFCILLVVLLVVLAVVLYMRFLKRKHLFYPEPLTGRLQLPASITQTAVKASNGRDTLAVYHNLGLYHPNQPVLIYCHGNAGNIKDNLYLFNHAQLPLIVWEYRGFGNSTGTATEKNVVDDLQCVIDWACKQWQLDRQRDVVLFGRSLGTNVVLHYVDKVDSPPDHIVLLTPFAKLGDVLHKLGLGVVGYLLALLVGNMDVVSSMRRYTEDKGGKTLLLASKSDIVTPWKSALQLVVSPAVQLIEIMGGHNRAFENWDAVYKFLRDASNR